MYQQPGIKRGSESPPDQLAKKAATTPAQKHPNATSASITSKTSSPNVAAQAVPPQAQMPVATKTSICHKAMENKQQQPLQQPPPGMNQPIPKIGPPLPSSIAPTAIDTTHSAYNHYPPPPVYPGPPPSNPKREEVRSLVKCFENVRVLLTLVFHCFFTDGSRCSGSSSARLRSNVSA